MKYQRADSAYIANVRIEDGVIVGPNDPSKPMIFPDSGLVKCLPSVRLDIRTQDAVLRIAKMFGVDFGEQPK